MHNTQYEPQNDIAGKTQNTCYEFECKLCQVLLFIQTKPNIYFELVEQIVSDLPRDVKSKRPWPIKSFLPSSVHAQNTL